MEQRTKRYLSGEEYLMIERAASYKSEFYHGEMFALAGASFNHNVISLNLVHLLHKFLQKRKCTIFHSDMRLYIPTSSLYTYPDVMLSCGKIEFLDNAQDTILNPILIAEVLSPSTENYDRTVKFDFYRAIPTLQDYLLISQDKIKIEGYNRTGEKSWNFIEYDENNNTVLLSCLNKQFNINELFINLL
jgi:Uma2 family endonuclease